jgi:hypothetical protein
VDRTNSSNCGLIKRQTDAHSEVREVGGGGHELTPPWPTGAFCLEAFDFLLRVQPWFQNLDSCGAFDRFRLLSHPELTNLRECRNKDI